jgi:hypothetical protein
MKCLIHEDRCTKICRSVSKPNTLPTRVHGILDTLGSRAVAACWTPNQLTEHCKHMHIGLCLDHLIWYESTSGAFLNQTVTGNETREHHVTSETKMASMIRKKFKTANSVHKLWPKAPAGGFPILTCDKQCSPSLQHTGQTQRSCSKKEDGAAQPRYHHP